MNTTTFIVMHGHNRHKATHFSLNLMTSSKLKFMMKLSKNINEFYFSVKFCIVW